MAARSFLDTNILVYTDDRDAPEKQRIALALIAGQRRAGTGVLSTQVLQEYFSAATTKLGVDAAVARRKVELFARMELVEVSLASILGGIDLHRLHGWSIWDALIVRAARDAGCGVLYSEDAGLRGAEGIEVVNPFAG